MFALYYYAPWLGSFVPERDRLGKLEIRYDPRDISHVYVRDPAGVAFRSVRRRDGILTPVTLWEHESDRANHRMANARSNVEKVQFRREIASVAGTRRKKLDQKKRLEIAESVLSGRKSGAEMARLYNISEPTVSRIVAAHRQTRSSHESQS